MTSRRRPEVLHAVLGATACILLPAGSWVEGTRLFAWTMFSASSTYRIEITEVDPSGRSHAVNPTALAVNAAPSAAAILAGSDHWRGGASLATLQDHVDDLARYVCTETGAATVQVTLRQRTGEAPERVARSQVTCRL
jgi:hypothetical protein